MSEINELYKVVFNKSHNWFELRMPDGTRVPGQTEMKIMISDDILNCPTRAMMATVTLLVEFGGEIEEPNGS
jgi:hypothetical protein